MQQEGGHEAQPGGEHPPPEADPKEELVPLLLRPTQGAIEQLARIFPFTFGMELCRMLTKKHDHLLVFLGTLLAFGAMLGLQVGLTWGTRRLRLAKGSRHLAFLEGVIGSLLYSAVVLVSSSFTSMILGSSRNSMDEDWSTFVLVFVFVSFLLTLSSLISLPEGGH